LKTPQKSIDDPLVRAQGLVTREMVRAQYDGSLFYQLARKNEARKALASKKY
jgi:hypothetical protein